MRLYEAYENYNFRLDVLVHGGHNKQNIAHTQKNLLLPTIQTEDMN